MTLEEKIKKVREFQYWEKDELSRRRIQIENELGFKHYSEEYLNSKAYNDYLSVNRQAVEEIRNLVIEIEQENASLTKKISDAWDRFNNPVYRFSTEEV